MKEIIFEAFEVFPIRCNHLQYHKILQKMVQEHTLYDNYYLIKHPSLSIQKCYDSVLFILANSAIDARILCSNLNTKM